VTVHDASYVPDVTVVDLTLEVQTTNHQAVVRRLVGAVLIVVLALALWTRRELIVDALDEMSRLSLVALSILLALTVYERWSRADIMRRLLGEDVTLGRAVTIHDVGTAVSKGVPLGGAVGTAMRWTIARDSGVGSTRFAAMLIAYGIATTFVSWLLPFGALLIDLTQRSATAIDIAILAVIAAVVTASATFWMIVLRSERLEGWAAGRIRSMWSKIAGRITSLDAHDPAGGVAEVRHELLQIALRPWSLLGRTLLAQLCGSVILFVALRALGVGGELEATEFFRVFFITHLLGTFAPTPGGIGVMEAGATGALVAAGVDTTTALAGVLIYRFLTYVLPIMLGAALYLMWRVRGSRSRPATLVNHGASFDTAVSSIPRAEDQGIRSG
jgi:uncharacterized protein (TIRG00374 family)